MFSDIKLLDCTLRDGGYYTNWNFDDDVVDDYISAMNKLPIDYIELGYRNNPHSEYLGKFAYTPKSVLSHIKKLSDKRLVLMINDKDTEPKDVPTLLQPICDLVDMIRIATAPEKILHALKLAEEIKKLGLKVSLNVMYMSTWLKNPDFMSNLKYLDGVVDLLCMVDSFGGIFPDDLKKIVSVVKENTSCTLGFHGHNNLQMGLINAVTAVECGVDCIDSTISGMGRGAGNLSTELLLTYLSENGLDVNLNVVGEVVSLFNPLLEKYQWGTNLPYMISGAYSIPQKDVMSWVSNRAYSFNSIVRALDNKRTNKKDNAKFPLFVANENVKNVLIIGGGTSVKEHLNAIKEYIKKYNSVLIFATCRWVSHFQDCDNEKYYVLVGNEAKRMKQNISKETFVGKCILSSYPRLMGTEVPDFAMDKTFEIDKVTFTDKYLDSCTTVSLQIALMLSAQEINIIGYDGYLGGVLSEKEAKLTMENRTIITDFVKNTNKDIVSLSETLYNELTVKSIYQFL